MQKTENLKLNIINGTDIPSHAVFNENFNKLDEFASTNNTNMENVRLRLDGIDNNITEIQNENSTQNTSISNLNERLQRNETELTESKTRISTLENKSLNILNSDYNNYKRYLIVINEPTFTKAYTGNFHCDLTNELVKIGNIEDCIIVNSSLKLHNNGGYDNYKVITYMNTSNALETSPKWNLVLSLTDIKGNLFTDQEEQNAILKKYVLTVELLVKVES